MQEASLEEGPVLRLIQDYFERAGHAECLVALENYCKDSGNANEVLKGNSFPPELAALRELSLNGKWDRVVQYLNAFTSCADQEGLEKCMYLAERQKYFEILHHIENNIRSKFRLGYSFPGNGELLSPKEIERTQNLIKHQLSVLEGISPSPEEFQLLKNLFSSSSLSCDEFSTWQLHSGRLETFYRIGEWVSKVLYLTVNFPKRANVSNLAKEDSCSLLRLVAKGLLYEQCENLCRMRCGESKKEELPKLLDLCSWIQQQPDSSFQTVPAEIVLMVKPLKSPDRHRGTSFCSLEVDEAMQNKSVQSNQVPLVSKDGSIMSSEADTETAEQSGIENTVLQGAVVLENVKASKENPNRSSQQQVKEQGISRQEPETLKALKIQDSKGESDQKQEPESPPSKPIATHEIPPAIPADFKASQASLLPSPPPPPISVVTSAHAHSNTALPVSSCNSICSQQDAVGMVDAGPSCIASEPSTITHLSNNSHNLPHMTSKPRITSSDIRPIQEISQSHQALWQNFNSTTNTPDKTKVRCEPHGEKPAQATASYATEDQHSRSQASGTKAKSGSTLFQAVPSNSEYDVSSIDRESRSHGVDMDVSGISMTDTWPVGTLVGTVTDPQVVRSVAFSESGGIVAVGANSSTLRLCYTAPLLHRHKGEIPELNAFYLSPQYHKSSIYCLSWFHDSILASGSNDQTIRLLTCSQDYKIAVNKPLQIHNGTVRDLTFTPKGLLVSGGGGVPEVKVTDIMTGQSTISLVGHTDQILAVGSLANETVISGGQDSMVIMWDLRSRNPVSKTNLASAVTSLTTCGEGLVAAHTDGSCSVLDLRSNQCTTTYTAHRGECRTVRTCPVDPKRAWVLSGSYDGTVCLANVAPAMADSTEPVQWITMCKHREKVIQCRWHPQGRLFASTGADKKACFWHIL